MKEKNFLEVNEMVKEKVIEVLNRVDRPGINDLIGYMNINGFFTAPCSGQYHLCKEGGLAEHSYNVFTTMWQLVDAMPAVFNGVTFDNIAIGGLLHDLGKMGYAGQPNYVPNILKSKEISKSKPYDTNSALLGIPHEVLSVSIASRFINLTVEEVQAIYLHNGLYTPAGNAVKGKETALYLLLHTADMIASRLIEVE